MGSQESLSRDSQTLAVKAKKNDQKNNDCQADINFAFQSNHGEKDDVTVNNRQKDSRQNNRCQKDNGEKDDNQINDC